MFNCKDTLADRRKKRLKRGDMNLKDSRLAADRKLKRPTKAKKIGKKTGKR